MMAALRTPRGIATVMILLVLAVAIVVGSTWLARRIGGSTT